MLVSSVPQKYVGVADQESSNLLPSEDYVHDSALQAKTESKKIETFKERNKSEATNACKKFLAQLPWRQLPKAGEATATARLISTISDLTRSGISNQAASFVGPDGEKIEGRLISKLSKNGSVQQTFFDRSGNTYSIENVTEGGRQCARLMPQFGTDNAAAHLPSALSMSSEKCLDLSSDDYLDLSSNDDSLDMSPGETLDMSPEEFLDMSPAEPDLSALSASRPSPLPPVDTLYSQDSSPSLSRCNFE